MERLTERTGEGQAIPRMELRNNGHQKCMERLAEYEELEEQGKLMKLTCAVGDTVYVILPRDIHITEAHINKIEVKRTIYGKMCYFIEPVAHRGHLYRYFENDFGKTVFLTREAAEAALKEL